MMGTLIGSDDSGGENQKQKSVLPFVNVAKFDRLTESGSPSNLKLYTSPDGFPIGEAVFAPRLGYASAMGSASGGGREDDGYLIFQRYDPVGHKVSFVVLDAREMEQVCEIFFDIHLPYGFHGCWLPEPQEAKLASL